MSIKKYIPNFIKELYADIEYWLFTKKNKIKIMKDEEVIENIVKNKKSIVRYGDGEFKWILGEKQNSFQDQSADLQMRLKEVLKCKDDKILVCIPEAFNNVNEYTKSSKFFWKNFIRWYGKDIIEYIDNEYLYGNTNFTRWYLEYENKNNMSSKLQSIKSIWESKDVLIVEGQDTKIGVNNTLLNNASSIERIIAPARNAFKEYDNIFNEVKKVKKNKLILIALGPTATVLAYDLAKLGYQALDIGHVDIEYEWYLKGTNEKIPIFGKFVNEAGGKKGEFSQDILKEYNKQIIKYIGVNHE